MLRPFAHSVACCDVAACCCAKFETGQTFQPTTPNISFVPWSPKRSATMLDPFAHLFQHCWGQARSLRMVYKDLWVVSFPRRTAGPSIVGSCCIRLHTTANTHATNTNIIGVTMLGVVASVCTQPNTQDLPVVNTQGSSTEFLFTYHSAIPEKSSQRTLFQWIVDFKVPFSINFLSSSAFLGFRKALEQDAMSPSVSVVRKLESF